MRKSASVTLLAIVLLLVATAPSHAWHHGRTHVFIGVGVGPAFWWGPPYPYWGYYPPPYYYAPPPVVVQAPPVYVQPPPPPSQSYWYYCPSAAAYYPYVQSCPEAWLRVAPRPE